MTNRQRALLRACRLFNRAGGLARLEELTREMEHARDCDGSEIAEHDMMALGGLTMLVVTITDMIEDLFPDCIDERGHRASQPLRALDGMAA